jgi:hypothetical protein
MPAMLANLTPDLFAALRPAPAPVDRTGSLGLTLDELDEALYALDLRADTLGTDPASQDARVRLNRARAALERELARAIDA